MRICKVEGCNEKHSGKGFCISHYQKWRYRNDLAYRNRQRRTSEIWRQNNKEYKNEKFKFKYATDEKFRQYYLNACREHSRLRKERWDSLNDEQQLALMMKRTNEIMGYDK